MSIRTLRDRANLTQAQLAKKIDVDQSAICRWERGKNPPLPKYQRKLSKLFGVTVDEILSVNDDILNTQTTS